VEVWSVGDLNYFVAVLNALAMVAGSGLFEDLFKVGLIMAVLWIGFEAMFASTGKLSGGIPFGRFIMAFIAFKLLFGLTTTVRVYDTYTLKAMNVDNVPYGVVTAGSFMSRISHEITATMEQAFSTPNLTQTGFATPLETLARAKRLPSGLDTLHDGRIKKTLVEYIEKCTCAGINMGQVSESQVRTASDPWAAMRWNSEIYYTMTWLPSDPAGGTLRTCTEAWGVINDYVHGQMWTDWQDFLRGVFCPTGSCNPEAEVQEALNSLNLALHNSRDYMLAAVLLPVFEQGQIQFNSFMGKPEMAVVIGQAREQRNAQWQAEASMFLNIVRPLMAFFEGFLYAAAPFMALLVAFVPAGLGLVGRYFQMFCWHQMWLPVLAILNHYTQIVAQQKLSALVGGAIPLTSLHGYVIGMSQLHDWLSVAGLLVASTPAIALALLYGGSVAMSHLAGRLQSGDYLDEKVPAPSITRQEPYLTPTSRYTEDPVRGLHVTGSAGIIPQVSVSEQLSQSAASSKQEAVASQQAFRSAMTQMLGTSMMASSGGSWTDGFRDGVSGRVTDTEALSYGLAHRIGHSVGLNNTETHQLQGMLSGAMKGQAGKSGGPGLSATMGPSLQQAFGQSRAQQIGEQIEGLMASTGESTLSAATEKVLMRDSAQQRMSQYIDGFDQKDMEQVEQSAQRALSAEQRYQETSQAVQQLGATSSLDLLQLSRRLMDTGGDYRAYLAKTAAAIPDINQGLDKMGNTVNKMDHLTQMYGGMALNKEQAGWMAMVHRLQEYQGPFRNEAQQRLGDLLMQAVGRQVAVGDSAQFKGVGGQVEQAGQAAFDKAQGLQPVTGVQEKIGGIRGEAMGPLPSDGEVMKWGTDWQGHVHDERTRKMMQGHLQKYDRTLDAAFQQFRQDPSMAQEATESALAAKRWLDKMGIEVGGVFSKTIEAIDDRDISKLDQNKTFDQFRQYALNQGLDENQANLYSAAACRNIDVLVREKVGGLGIGFMQNFDAHKEEFITGRAAELQRLGASPEDSSRMARQEADMIVASGATGQNYISRVSGAQKELKNLHQQVNRMGPVGRWDSLIQESSRRNGVDPNLVRAVMLAESGGNPRAESPKGAIGLMQLMPGTAKGLGVQDPWDPAQNIEGGAKYLRQNLNKFSGDLTLALAAYNAGPGNVQKHRGVPPFEETQNYVSKVLDLYRQGSPAPKATPGKTARVM